MTLRRVLLVAVLVVIAEQTAWLPVRFADIGDRLDRIEAGLAQSDTRLGRHEEILAWVEQTITHRELKLWRSQVRQAVCGCSGP